MEKIGPCPIFFIFYFQKLLKKQNFLKTDYQAIVV
jgi:hypothetical protein